MTAPGTGGPRAVRTARRVPSDAAGVFTRADAAASGWTTPALRHALRTGRIGRVKRGVFAVRDHDTADMQAAVRRELALLTLARATARICERATLSHTSAAIASTVPLLTRPDRPCLTVEAGTALRSLAGVHLHRAALPDHHVVRLDGYSTTSIARTVMDIAREHGSLAGVVAADAALHRRLVDEHELREVAEFCATWPGRAAIRQVLELCDPLTESVLESVSRVRMLEFGLPAPLPQRELGNEYGWFLARVDFYWPEFGVVGESDGSAKYRDPAVVAAERRAEAALRDLGVRIVRWDWYDAFHFAPIAQRLRREFALGIPAGSGQRWSVLNGTRVRAAS